MELCHHFPRYNLFNPLAPVWCVTPHEGRVIHRFFDTSPFSPSGRYLALLRLPVEDRNALPGETAEVVLVDLHEGTERVLANTRGWEIQVGAHVQWGSADTALYYNDVERHGWQPHGVKMNPFTGEQQKLDGCIFMLSPDGTRAATTCPVRARRTQLGYGVILPDEYVPRNRRLAEDDGLFITDTATGACILVASLKDIVEQVRSAIDWRQYADGEFYGFQCKWNPQGTRLLIVVRWVSNQGLQRKNHVITMRGDGSDIHLAIPAVEWAKGGHHINWHPDGEHLTMNLNLHGDGLRFVQVRHDGTDLHALLDDVQGSGHPTVHRDGIHILTDTYCGEPLAYADGTIPLRLIDLRSGEEREVARMRTKVPYPDNTLRVDAHPAWDSHFRWIAFNGYAGGTRRVYVADFSTLVG
ncbi:MAG: hypothetical protein BWY76_02372 [bacterium ADurb.Bin429]|nr:MAG: hypothetical protein BWY76_02372 [bacterium ADurb.Bin429]